MSKEQNIELIQQATRALKLRDIVLYESQLIRGEDPPEETTAVLQNKRGVEYFSGKRSEKSEFDDSLQVRVALGVRCVFGPDEDIKTIFEITADFVVDYDSKEQVSAEAMKAFAEINSVHLLWPFWRQHVYDVVARARLPNVDVPLLAGVKL